MQDLDARASLTRSLQGTKQQRRLPETCRTAPSATLAALLLAACASLGGPGETERREQWKAEWNARDAAASTRMENPCGDFEFDPWVQDFLTPCEPVDTLGRGECAQRLRWVSERSHQCGEWQSWLLRNVGRHERRDHLPEPPTAVE